jgi:hypothetical protein
MGVCDSWTSISSIIPSGDFVGWGAAGVSENCYSYCVKQLDKAGYKLRSPGWTTSAIGAGLIYQTYVSKKVGKMTPGYQVTQFELGVEYAKRAITNNIPVMFGVDHSSGSPNADKVTDHFVTVVGMGTDAKGKYFLFYDNATGVVEVGTSDQNRIYCDCTNNSLIGDADTRNTYFRSGYGKYTVTQIRESVKK